MQMHTYTYVQMDTHSHLLACTHTHTHKHKLLGSHHTAGGLLGRRSAEVNVCVSAVVHVCVCVCVSAGVHVCVYVFVCVFGVVVHHYFEHHGKLPINLSHYTSTDWKVAQ